jgi:hypothetical protein
MTLHQPNPRRIDFTLCNERAIGARAFAHDNDGRPDEWCIECYPEMTAEMFDRWNAAAKDEQVDR